MQYALLIIPVAVAGLAWLLLSKETYIEVPEPKRRKVRSDKGKKRNAKATTKRG